ncbi:MAG TPA: HlyD family efflux transporter periplasmic adaptor subunit [Acidobacteriaceae bacterium]|jgi:putative peptide zinc metalloprotease protein|nr:HlyD family efflux transporter periplasmic adaptor subunit [Acidobacteriaceae bacterium]
MNLAEALNAALPDLPARRVRAGYPKLNPALIHHENIDDGERVIIAMIRGEKGMFRFTPEQWQIIELFDGKRSWEEVSELVAQRYSVRYEADDLREFTSGLDAIDFWYKTPLEKNVALQQKLEEGRHEHAHRKSKWGDVAHMQFSAWDPDEYLNRIYPRLKWMYTRWFGLFCAVLFAFMAWMFVFNWGQIGHDTLDFYTFTNKSAADLAEFWVLFLILGFFHESSHGLTCKHYGGEVHSMGFHLIYLTPAFFVDVSEAWVYATRWQRLMTILAGIGIELIFCAVATVVWWGTPPGSGVHDLAYKIMLITGVAVVVVNMNPLIKLDGYFAFSEIIGFSDIKEKSTAYLSGLVRRGVFGLPAEMEFVPKRRRAGYIAYAILSGAYSYVLLFTVVRFSYNVFSKFSPDWGFVPALALALVIFKSRIRTLLRFMQTVYLDKRDRVRAWLTGPRLWGAAAALLLLCFLPLFHETVTARFLLEPVRLATVRTTVPGRVMAVMVREGQSVRAGESLLRMENAALDSARAGSGEQFALTGEERVRAQLNHRGLGEALQQHTRAGVEETVADEESDQLVARAPIDGVVMAPRMRDFVGSTLDAGTLITGIADLRAMRARIFIPEYAVGRVHPGARVRLLADGAFAARTADVADIQPDAGDLPPAVESIREIKGSAKLEYYIADAIVPNDGSLHSGMTGTARIVVRRASLAQMMAKVMRDFVDRKLW